MTPEDLRPFRCKPGEHDYVDLYGGWGISEDDPQVLLCWVFCKKCLNKKCLSFNMREFEDYQEGLVRV